MAEVDPLSLCDSGADSSGLVSETAISLIAFAEGVEALQPQPPDATLERRLMLNRAGSIMALVGVVPIVDYNGADSERRLSDIAWLAPRVRSHAELVEWMTQWSSVFPAPFGTLYSRLDNLTAFMHTHEATIATFLRAVADKEEWELRAVAHFGGPDALDQLACDAARLAGIIEGRPVHAPLPRQKRVARLRSIRGCRVRRRICRAASTVDERHEAARPPLRARSGRARTRRSLRPSHGEDECRRNKKPHSRNCPGGVESARSARAIGTLAAVQFPTGFETAELGCARFGAMEWP